MSAVPEEEPGGDEGLGGGAGRLLHDVQVRGVEGQGGGGQACTINTLDKNSVADPGCLFRIRIFYISDPGSQFFPIPDLHKHSNRSARSHQTQEVPVTNVHNSNWTQMEIYSVPQDKTQGGTVSAFPLLTIFFFFFF
jgi:hypothetical protein